MREDRIIVRMSKREKEDLAKLAEAHGLSTSTYIRYIITQEMKKFEKKDVSNLDNKSE